MQEAGLKKMTLIRPIETETSLGDAYELTRHIFEEAARELRNASERIAAGENLSETELKKTASFLTGSMHTMMKERDRVLEQRKQSAGFDGGYAIDFEAVKAEIGCKLDRLRRAKGTEGVPG